MSTHQEKRLWQKQQLCTKHGISSGTFDIYEAAFAAHDDDESGTLDLYEIQQVMRSGGQAPNKDDLLNVIKRVTANHLEVGFDDFIGVMRIIEAELYVVATAGPTPKDLAAAGSDAHLCAKYGVTPEQLRVWHATFEAFDVDNSGTINVDELTAVFEASGYLPPKGEAMQMIKDSKVQGGSTRLTELNFEEFVNCMKSHEAAREANTTLKHHIYTS